jgi:hypothetical protein
VDWRWSRHGKVKREPASCETGGSHYYTALLIVAWLQNRMMNQTPRRAGRSRTPPGSPWKGPREAVMKSTRALAHNSSAVMRFMWLGELPSQLAAAPAVVWAWCSFAAASPVTFPGRYVAVGTHYVMLVWMLLIFLKKLLSLLIFYFYLTIHLI